MKGRKRGKRTDGQIAVDEVFISELYAKGRNHREIKDALNAQRPYTLTRAVISGQIQGILEEWQLRALDSIGRRVAEARIKIDRVEREAWDGYERSQRESMQTVNEQRGDEEPAPAKKKSRKLAGVKKLARVIREMRDGDARWLMVIMACVRERNLLEGNYPMKALGSGVGPDAMPAAAVIPSEIRVSTYAPTDPRRPQKIIYLTPKKIA